MKELRTQKGITQTQAAEDLRRKGLSFHQQTIQRIENGDRSITLDEAYAIADYFDVSVQYMVEEPRTLTAASVEIAIKSLREQTQNTYEVLAPTWAVWNDLLAATLDLIRRGEDGAPEVAELEPWLRRGIRVEEAIDRLVSTLAEVAGDDDEGARARTEFFRDEDVRAWAHNHPEEP
jgi:transcriptional regulator with XRE-family HTH domain